MIQDFSFSWNGRHWHGYLHAVAHETVIAHFEDEHIRETLGQFVSFSRAENGVVAYAVDAAVQQSHAGIYEALKKGVELGLGKALQHFLN